MKMQSQVGIKVSYSKEDGIPILVLMYQYLIELFGLPEFSSHYHLFREGFKKKINGLVH